MFIVTAFEVLIEGGRGVQVHAAAASHLRHEQVLLIGYAAFLVVDDLAVAIEGETVLDVAPDAKDGYGLICGGQGGEPISKRAGGVGAVQYVNYALGGEIGRASCRERVFNWV